MTFPADPLDVKVEISPGADLTANPTTWTWTDITSSVRLPERIEIRRGRQDETDRVEPSRCVLRLDNRTGDFTPRNPLGQWYGSLGRNTPIRVQVNPGSGYVDRFNGYVSSWPPRWLKDVPADATVPIEADGILRRLGQGAKPLNSAIRRAFTDAGVVAYWPLEDGGNSPQFGSAIEGHPTAVLLSTASRSTDDTLPGCAPLPKLTTNDGLAVRATVPSLASSTSWQVEFFLNVEAEPGSARTLVEILTSGTGTVWRITVADPSPGFIEFEVLGETGTSLISNSIDTTDFYGGWIHVQVNLSESAGTVSGDVRYSPVDSSTEYVTSTLGFSGTLGQVTRVSLFATGSDTTVSMGHIGVFATTDSTDHWVADDGHRGEAAHDRIQRLCTENDILLDLDALDAQFDTPMGPQPVASLLEVLHDCEETDQGVLYESGFGLGYVPRGNRYNRTVDMELDFDTGDIAEPPEPTDDDQSLRNRCVVSRVDGSSAVAEDAESIAAVGLYDEQRTVNVATDDVLAGHAAWCVHLGTTDEMRWPRIDLNLARSPDLITDWLACDLQSRVTADNPPDEVAGDDIDVAIEGYDEFLGYRDWLVGLNTSPAGPYNVGVYDTSRYDTAGSELAAQFVAGTNTSMSVSTTSGPLWTTGAVNFDIECGGARLTVTDISGASSPQTFTITQTPVNGIIKTLASGTAVKLWQPGRYAL